MTGAEVVGLLLLAVCLAVLVSVLFGSDKPTALDDAEQITSIRAALQAEEVKKSRRVRAGSSWTGDV